MARRHKNSYTILPWLSGRSDCREPRYIQAGVTLFEHPAFQALTPAQRLVYLAMCIDAGGKREFTFSKARFTHYGVSNATARAAIAELIDAGFITRLYSGRTTREPSAYAFSDRWKVDRGPSADAG